MAVYPLKSKVTSYITVGPAKFGAPRPNGRKHAGVDMGIPAGAPVFAIGSGTVLESMNTSFFTDVDAGIDTGVVSVKHDFKITVDGTEYDSFVIRYGEVNQVTVKAGDTVTEGKQIATVAKQGSQGTELHLELYLGEQGMGIAAKFRGVKKPYMRTFNPTDATSLLNSLNVKP